ncbi:MAG: transposase [Epulopiscium sp. Nele67-Bin004]|nr:MAG: transposase [Epulopiscium sp. Nele67-Bin004]
MMLTTKCVIQQLSKSEYKQLKHLTRLSKNLVNQAIYRCRQQWFENKTFPSHTTLCAELKTSENYIMLGSHVGQQILFVVVAMFNSYKELRNKALAGTYPWSKVKLPNYLDKDGYFLMSMCVFPLKDGVLTIPQSRKYKKTHSKIFIKIPDKLKDKHINQVRIIPKNDARNFEIHYVYEAEAVDLNLNKDNALAIDLGVNNLMTCVTNNGKSFIIDGKKIKSINQWYNKLNAKLQRIKDLQGNKKHYTKTQCINLSKRNNKVTDYMHKAVNMVIKYCIQNDIGNIVIGYNENFKHKANLGPKNNQAFVNIPYAKILSYIEYKSNLVGINVVKQEESYTSKASALDNDFIPVYDEKDTTQYEFSGRRVKRGLYKTKQGYLINADLNGAMNIMIKSSVVTCDFASLYSRGELNTPIRKRVA